MTIEQMLLAGCLLVFLALTFFWLNPNTMLPVRAEDRLFHYLIVGYSDVHKRDFVWEMGHGHWVKAKWAADIWKLKGEERGNYISDVRYVRVSRLRWYYHLVFQPMHPGRFDPMLW